MAMAMMRHDLGGPQPLPPPSPPGGGGRGRRCPAPGPRPPAAGPGQESGGTQGSQGREDPDTQGAGRVEAGGRRRSHRQLDPEHGAVTQHTENFVSSQSQFLSAYLLDPFG